MTSITDSLKPEEHMWSFLRMQSHGQGCMLLSRILSECRQPQISLSLCATWGQQEIHPCRGAQASGMRGVNA